MELSVLTGRVDLKNVIVRPSAINEILEAQQLPICVKAGMISKVHIKVSI